MKFIQKVTTVLGSSLAISLAVAVPASAHVVVKPSETLTGSFQTFSVSAPNEKTVPYTTIKLDIPDSVTNVMPTVKPGWTITMDKTGDGETAVVKSITWQGSVDGGFRDEFTFSAKVPDAAGELDWKAYQTYADGTVVSWDQKPVVGDAESESETSGPLSVTNVVTETSADAAARAASDQAHSAKQTAQVAFAMAIAGLAISLVFLARISKK